MLGGEGTIQVDLDHADLLAALGEVIDDLVQGLADGAHGDDHALGVGCAVVVEQLVVTAGQLADGVHLLLDDLRQSVVGGVAGLAGLEEGVGVLQGGADGGVLGVEGVVAEALHGVPIQQLAQLVVVQQLDLLDLMAGAEVHEGDGALDGAQVGDAADVHAFLHGGGGQHGKAGLTAGHGVGVIAEDGDGVGADGTGGDVHDARQHGTGNAEHGRDHQHQALGGGVGGGQRAGLQRAVHGAAGAGLGLELHQLHGLAEEVLFAVGGPVVDVVGHGAGRGDGVDGGDFGERIAYVCGGLVAVHRFEDFGISHWGLSSFLFEYCT